MKIKTSELAGPALDWAVAKAEGILKYITFDFELTHPLIVSGIQSYGPSFIWSQGGPIIEREGIELRYRGGWWAAFCFDNGTADHYGPQILAAAMRCYVANKLGDEVDVPKELCHEDQDK